MLPRGTGASMPRKEDEDTDELDKIAKASVSLDRKDYVALMIASLETIFLPLVVLVAVIIIILILLRR
jgi:hypothetical protein